MDINNKHLFLFTIGPVQSFISQARKTQDLYMGSQILTELIKEAIDEAGKNYGRKNIIFPYAYPDNHGKWNEVKSLPNRFIALIDKDKDLPQIGKDTEAKVRNKWHQRSTLAALKGANQVKTLKIKKAYNQQIEQHLEIFWLFQPIEKGGYQSAYKQIEHHLGGIKNIRVFQQFDYYGNLGEKGRKCSIDGERNALFFGARTNSNYYNKLSKWNPDASILTGIPNVMVAPNEGLSAVSFVKRFSIQQKSGFDSTAKIALLNIETAPIIKQKIEIAKKEVKYFDHQLLFDENLTVKYFEKHGLNIKKIPKIKQIVKDIETLAKANNLKKNSYYALLSFDGDSMGEWLSKAADQDQHRDFSKLLMDFAEKAKGVLENKDLEFGNNDVIKAIHRGRTVYAGGDDFLGFVNLEYLFETIEYLKSMFDEEVAARNPIKHGGKRLTMSMGVVIAHYKMPLSIVIKRVKDAEKAAKKSRGNKKNALAIEFITHSGSNRLGIIPFGKKGQNLQKVKVIFDLLRSNFSGKWINSFAKTFYGFTDVEDNPVLKVDYRPLVEIELKRLILRACNLKGSKKESQSRKLHKNACQLFEATDFNFSNFTEMLYITNALVSKTSN